jgi:precorrin-6B methylase 2
MIIVILIILQYLLFLAILAILSYLAFIMMSFRDVVPYVPTPRRIIKRIIELADIKKGERICDLGSGTGRIIIPVAKIHKENLVVGIEKSLLLRLVTRFRLLFHPFIRRRIQIVNQDFFNIELAEYDVLFCFLTAGAMRILTPKFRLLKPGSRIFSYMFPIEDSHGFRETTEHISASDSIYLYEKL